MMILYDCNDNNDTDDADVADEIPLTMMMLTNFMKIMRTIQE